MSEKMFPIQPHTKYAPHPMQIPWSVAEIAYSTYVAKYGRCQTLERLAERGGFSPGEMDVFCPDWRARCDVIVSLRQQVADLTTRAKELSQVKITVSTPHEVCDGDVYGTIADIEKLYGKEAFGWSIDWGKEIREWEAASMEMMKRIEAAEAERDAMREAVRVLGVEVRKSRGMKGPDKYWDAREHLNAMDAVDDNSLAAAAVRVEQETMCSLCDHPMSEHGKHGCGVLMDSAWTASNAKPCGCRGADKRKDHQ